MARILVAEDEPSVRAFVSRALRAAGHIVTVVGDGVEALEKVATEGCDLLLADIRMPRLDGVELALMVSRDHPGLPVLLMTGYATEQQRAHNLSALIHGVLQKPFTLEQVCVAAAEALASSSDQ